MSLTTVEYLDQINLVWDEIATRIEDNELDCDSFIIGSVLTVESPDHKQIIINRQEPKHELWLASEAGASHYVFKDGNWVNTIDGKSFWYYLDLAFVAIGEQPMFADLYLASDKE